MYDASGVRLHAGKQATVLNIIISQLPADHPSVAAEPLRDRLGHTPRQVSKLSLMTQHTAMMGSLPQTRWKRPENRRRGLHGVSVTLQLQDQ